MKLWGWIKRILFVVCVILIIVYVIPSIVGLIALIPIVGPVIAPFLTRIFIALLALWAVAAVFWNAWPVSLFP